MIDMENITVEVHSGDDGYIKVETDAWWVNNWERSEEWSDKWEAFKNSDDAEQIEWKTMRKFAALHAVADWRDSVYTGGELNTVNEENYLTDDVSFLYFAAETGELVALREGHSDACTLAPERDDVTDTLNCSRFRVYCLNDPEWDRVGMIPELAIWPYSPVGHSWVMEPSRYGRSWVNPDSRCAPALQGRDPWATRGIPEFTKTGPGEGHYNCPACGSRMGVEVR